MLTAAATVNQFDHTSPGSTGAATAVRRVGDSVLVSLSAPVALNPRVSSQQHILARRAPLALRSVDPLAQLHAANTMLHDSRLGPDSPIAAAAAVRLGRDGDVVAARCGDAQVWVRRGGTWQGLLTGPALTDAGQRAWEHASAAGPAGGIRRWLELRELLRDRRLWQTLPLGAAPSPLLQQAATGGVDAVVVATATAKLAAGPCGALDSHLRRLHGLARDRNGRLADYAVAEVELPG